MIQTLPLQITSNSHFIKLVLCHACDKMFAACILPSICHWTYFHTSKDHMTWIIKKVNRIPTHCGVAYESVCLLARGHVIGVWFCYIDSLLQILKLSITWHLQGCYFLLIKFLYLFQDTNHKLFHIKPSFCDCKFFRMPTW